MLDTVFLRIRWLHFNKIVHRLCSNSAKFTSSC